ncbi:MAG: hypothetical protein OXQ31_25320 [Spirochaetaceae bacterium]|nr:hypothetical protein [Spirochaetaceae bacterium]
MNYSKSKAIPGTIRYLLLFGAIADLFSLAGFPVVDYAESLHDRMIEDIPRLYKALVFFFIGVTVSQIIGSGLMRFSENVALATVKGRRDENDKRVVPEGKEAEFRSTTVLVFMTVTLLGTGVALWALLSLL